MKPLNNLKMAYKAYLKLALILITSLLGMCYVLFSYYQVAADIKARDKALFLKAQGETTEAFHLFQQFLNLTESRLLNSLSKTQSIPSILSGHIERLMDKAFPAILSITFISASAPHIRYTSFGKSLLPGEMTSDGQKSDFEYLGKGTFKINKILYNDRKRAFGTLHSTFSVASFLYRNFSEEELEIIYDQGRTLEAGRLFFKIPHLPYIFILNREIPSFWQFFWGLKLQAFFTLLFGLTLFFVGFVGGITFNRKKLMRQYSISKKLEAAHLNLESEKKDLGMQLIALQHLVKLKERSTEEIHCLFSRVQERYQKMAIRTQALTTLTSNLILEEAENNNLLQKIHDVSHEGTLVLKYLARGFLMKDEEEPVNVIEALEKIKMIFLPEMIARSSAFEIQGKPKENFLVDKGIFEIVLHNIFHIVMDRLNKNNLFKIVITEDDALQLTFVDDGYDVGDRMQNVNSPIPENILRLQKKELREFSSHLGWTLSFQRENESLNVIRLLIPQESATRRSSANVVNFLNFKARIL
jgi:hypothetical protein